MTQRGQKQDRGRSARNKPAASEALEKILALEAAQGYQNRAVTGGLDLFLENFADELAGLLSAASLPGPSYGTLSDDERRAWVKATSDVSPTLRGNEKTPSAPASEKKATSTRPAATRKKSPGGKLPRPKPPPSRSGRLTLETAIEDLRFIRKPTVEKLHRIEVQALSDLVYLFPNRHIDYSKVTPIAELEIDANATVVGRVVRSGRLRIGRGAAKISLNDGTGIIESTWFNQPYLADQFRSGTRLVLSGKVQVFRQKAQFQNPEYEVMVQGEAGENIHAGGLLPVYPATEGIAQRTLRNAVSKALDLGLPLVVEPLPAELRARLGFAGLSESLRGMHNPVNQAEADDSRRRLAFEELFINQLAVQQRRLSWQERDDGVVIANGGDSSAAFIDALPFELTEGQQISLAEVFGEISRPTPMGRLLQGEVGSGKTVIAVAAMLATVRSGYQSAMMAPTEVLAEQHYLNITTMLGSGSQQFDGPAQTLDVPGMTAPVQVALLLGSLRESQRKIVRQGLSSGDIDIAVGTHALMQDAVTIPRLALAVVDEQHRFGVEQRAALHGKGLSPHLLAMSATPIPRSLSLTLYGDLDLSTLKELPSGRKEIETRWLRSVKSLRDAYQLIRKQVEQGRQAFIVCPLIDPSDLIDARSATEEYGRLRLGELQGLSIGLLHGRMSLAEKQEIMARFNSNELGVLVATPVIEVGIDVPNATVMMIQSAERFGLSQLHQLRGRVGRGAHKSYCLVHSDSPGQDARERLSIIERMKDGFELSEEDLRIRGPGDYLGTRQSGFAEFKIASLFDRDLMDLARSEALSLVKNDPRLLSPIYAPLASRVKQESDRMLGEIS